MKKCRKCGEVKPLDEFNNSKSKYCKDGKFQWCRKCASAGNAAWRAANAERLKIMKAAYHAKNAEKIHAKNAAWVKANIEHVRKRAAEYRANNRESAKARSVEWRAANRERSRATVKAWQAANPEKKKRIIEAWKVNNPTARREYEQNREAKKRAGGRLSRGIVKKLFEAQQGLCACCGLPLGDDYHLDHIFPISRGGLNTDDNVQLLRKRCNLQKSNKLPDEYLRLRSDSAKV